MGLSVRQEFDRRAARWERETGHISNAATRMQHPDFVAIRNMGPAAIPWVLWLCESGRYSVAWFSLLADLTGEVVVPEPEKIGDSGFVAINVNACNKAWIEWGRRHGHFPPQAERQVT